MCLDYELLRLPETSIFKWFGYIDAKGFRMSSIQSLLFLLVNLSQTSLNKVNTVFVTVFFKMTVTIKNMELKWLLGVLPFFSFPAFSAQVSFSFIEFNIAFVLGLSLPVLLFAIFMKSVARIKWGFLVAITATVLGLLYSIAYLQQTQLATVLTIASLYISTVCLWPIFHHRANSKSKVSFASNLIVSLVVTFCLLYIALLWFVHTLDMFMGWAALLGIILCIHALQIWQNDASRLRFVLQWLLVASFAVMLYFWLYTQVPAHYIVTILVLSYLSVVVNGCWLLVQRIFAEFPVPDNIEKISPEELFTYTHDPATNLPTAQHALKHFEQVLKTSKDKRFAAIVLKPINFVQVNTVLGHHNSDILLLQLAYCLQQKVASNQQLLSFDISPEPVRLARLQSLHFLVVFDLSTTKHDDESVINNLCSELASAVPDAMSFKSFSLNFELAFGVALTGKHGDSVNEVVAHAGDALLFAEKQQQTLSYFDNKTVLHTERQLARMEKLRTDIVNEQLSWYLQPQVNIKDKSIYGFELKVQWQVSNNEMLELADFIDTAEHSGEVYLLTKQMFKCAFKTLFSLHKKGLYQRVSVSLSSKNLLETDLVDYIEEQMKNFNIAGKFLMIELSEPILIAACDRAKNIIDQLKSLDIAIAIADFSGSYESLRYLRKMAIHQVKINCNQLANIEDNRADKAIINALITLTRSMKLPLVGTHIDKQESMSTFTAMGGELIQGKIIHNGIDLAEIDKWLEQWFMQHPK